MTACKYCSAAAMGNAERGIGCSFQLARMWDQFALHALTNCHLCKNGHRWIERLSTSGASLALLPHRSGVAQRKRVGLITQRSVDRNHPSLPFNIQTAWGISSIGRVRALQARGTGIETRILHHFVTIRVALVAQMVERRTFNPVVAGSSPAEGAFEQAYGPMV